MSLETFIESSLDEYCDKMGWRGTWADHVVVINMAKMLQRDIMIVNSAQSGPRWKGVSKKIVMIKKRDIM